MAGGEGGRAAAPSDLGAPGPARAGGGAVCVPLRPALFLSPLSLPLESGSCSRQASRMASDTCRQRRGGWRRGEWDGRGTAAAGGGSRFKGAPSPGRRLKMPRLFSRAAVPPNHPYPFPTHLVGQLVGVALVDRLGREQEGLGRHGWGSYVKGRGGVGRELRRARSRGVRVRSARAAVLGGRGRGGGARPRPARVDTGLDKAQAGADERLGRRQRTLGGWRRKKKGGGGEREGNFQVTAGAGAGPTPTFLFMFFLSFSSPPAAPATAAPPPSPPAPPPPPPRPHPTICAPRPAEAGRARQTRPPSGRAW